MSNRLLALINYLDPQIQGFSDARLVQFLSWYPELEKKAQELLILHPEIKYYFLDTRWSSEEPEVQYLPELMGDTEEKCSTLKFVLN